MRYLRVFRAWARAIMARRGGKRFGSPGVLHNRSLARSLSLCWHPAEKFKKNTSSQHMAALLHSKLLRSNCVFVFPSRCHTDVRPTLWVNFKLWFLCVSEHDHDLIAHVIAHVMCNMNGFVELFLNNFFFFLHCIATRNDVIELRITVSRLAGWAIV